MARDYIQQAIPDSSLPKAEKERAMASIDDWVRRNRSWIYPRSAVAPCSVHGGNCPVRMHRFAKYMESGPEPKDVPHLGLSQNFVDSKLKHVKTGKDRPILVNSAGVTCLAWCAPGFVTCTGHPSAKRCHFRVNVK